ncbi:hypothetical protein [Bartonella massiliensis]|uniref:hypothetical protein n=1 Tax=Bartonella massiliensis TaxID=929795 RepID=UPI001FE7FF32|nr:hypothetical protein [Bartonella massiliensis]
MVISPTIITIIVKIWRKKGIVSAAILEPLAWILACAFLLLPIVFILLFIVNRQLKKMIRQLEEEVEQKKALIILTHGNESEK